MQSDGSSQRSIAGWVHRSEWLQIGMVAFGYIVCARFASLYALTKTGVVVLWLPNAIVLSALMLTPTRQWWKYGITLVVAELLSDAGAFPLWQALGFALANLFEVLLAGFLIRRVCGRNFAFSNLREVLMFAAIAMGVAPALAALLGSAIHFSYGKETINFFEHWQVWWIGDGMGLVVLTPLLFGWLHISPQDHQEVRPCLGRTHCFCRVVLCTGDPGFFHCSKGTSSLDWQSLAPPSFVWLGCHALWHAWCLPAGLHRESHRDCPDR